MESNLNNDYFDLGGEREVTINFLCRHIMKSNINVRVTSEAIATLERGDCPECAWARTTKTVASTGPSQISDWRPTDHIEEDRGERRYIRRTDLPRMWEIPWPDHVIRDEQ